MTNQPTLRMACHVTPLYGDGAAIQPLYLYETYEAAQLLATPNPTIAAAPPTHVNPWDGPFTNRPKRRWLRRRK